MNLVFPGTHNLHKSNCNNGKTRSLRNAPEFTINLTEFYDNTLFTLKMAMDENRDVITQRVNTD